MATAVSIRFPEPVVAIADEEPSGITDAFSVDSVGTGSFTGLSYEVPAHASGTISVDINVLSLTSEDIANLNALIKGMLSASEQDKVTTHEQTSSSADLGFFDFFGGGASASYSSTTDTMHSMGLTDAQITQIITAMMAIAQKMSNVTLKFTIDNTQSDYSVSGDLELYTIAGTITSGETTAQYRMLANKGTAGAGGPPATGQVIPLS